MSVDPEILTARELATHANDIKHLQTDMDKVVKDLEEVKAALARIERMVAEEQAKEATIVRLLTVGAGLIGGAIVWALDKFFK